MIDLRVIPILCLSQSLKYPDYLTDLLNFNLRKVNDIYYNSYPLR